MEGSTNTLNRTAIAASAEPPKVIGRHAGPLALWHLLSLDAPSIAALWTWFIASANHIHLPLASTLAMALAVWMLYAADRLMDARLMDARLLKTHHEGLEARHYFHHRHRTAFLTGILLTSIALALLLPHLEPEAIPLYLILGALVSGYFLLIHATRSAHRLPKEIAVGLCFAAATFIPTVARRPDLRLPLFPSALLFATLCSLNCLFIYAWENPSLHSTQRTHAITRLALRNLPFLTILLTLASAALSLLNHHAPAIPRAIAASAALLLVLHNARHAIPRITLRAAADLALTTPILLLPFLHP
jgi:hypothetical protein